VRRAAPIVAAGLLLAVALVLIGRWEASGHAERQNEGIASVKEAVGPLDSPSLRGFRFLARFQCVVYRRGKNEFALELCVDPRGRVVEAIDRRSGETEWWSLREDPDSANVRVDRSEVERLIVRMCPRCQDIFERAKTGAPGPPSG
jgi:hypothetical protein